MNDKPNQEGGSAGELADLRQQLVEAEERNLNAIDAIQGAEAQVAQAKRDAADYFHRLDIRERELRQLKEFLGFELQTPIEEVLTALRRSERTGAASGEV